MVEPSNQSLPLNSNEPLNVAPLETLVEAGVRGEKFMQIVKIRGRKWSSFTKMKD